MRIKSFTSVRFCTFLILNYIFIECSFKSKLASGISGAKEDSENLASLSSGKSLTHTVFNKTT